MVIKVHSIKAASLTSALISSVIFAAVIALLGTASWGETIAVVAICFTITFLVSYFLFNRYVLYRIKPIYQILLSKNVKTKQIRRELGNKGDIMNNVENALNTLVQKNYSEISRLKDNERYRKEFLGNVSHEIKTPLFSIQGYILTLLDGGIDDPSINRKYLERTERNIDRLIGIVQDLEEISKLESGRVVLNKSKFDLLDLIRECIESLEMDARRLEMTIEVDAHDTDSFIVNADRKQIEQVFNNLIINAIKYGSKGGRVVISFVDIFDKVMVEVADDGVGISEEDLPRVFERFFRTEKSRANSLGGRGLGLSIVKHIIEAHNQTITVRSKLGVGTTFSFTLSKN